MTAATSFAIPGSTRFRKHEHDTSHVCVVLQGGFTERESTGWRDVGAGTVRVTGAARHDIDFSKLGATCMVLDVDAESMAAPRSPLFIDRDEQLMAIAGRLDRYAKRVDPLARVRRADLTTELLAQIDRRLRGKAAPSPPWLSRIRDLVNDSRGDVSVEELAREAGVHRVHVARTFRDHYGISVSTYARRVRVESAIALLATSDMTLSQLAFDSGFSDQSHLTREIRAAIGETPGALRARLHPFKT